jgi:hypothetical protein
MKSSSVICILSTILLFIGSGMAQIADRFNFSGGAGVALPIASAGRNLNTGFNLDFRGGYNLNSHISADLDFGYNYWNLNSAALRWHLLGNPAATCASGRLPLTRWCTCCRVPVR